MSRIGFSLMALAVAARVADEIPPAPRVPRAFERERRAARTSRGESESSPRSGALHVTKECSEYTRLAGGFCTITSSNLDEIEVGSKVIYTIASGPTILDTDVTLDLPGPGNNKAFGHVVLALAAGQGR